MGYPKCDDFPISYMEPCLFKDADQEPWRAGLFKEVAVHNFLPFQSLEGFEYAQTAPLAGNEKMIGRVGDAFGLIDRDILVKGEWNG